jgi:hypothetical protein
MHSYTSLGAVPSIAPRRNEKRDALLARTGPAARAILRRINTLPRAARAPELNRVLADFDPDAPSRLHRVSERLYAQGYDLNAAVERALALTLADASIEHFKRLGMRGRSGGVYPLGDSTTSAPGQDAGAIVAGLIQGITCTPALRDSVSTLVGRNEGQQAHDATRLGFDAARSMSMCPTTPVPPVAPPASETSSGPSYLVPVLVGVGALAVAGGVIWYSGRKQR